MPESNVYIYIQVCLKSVEISRQLKFSSTLVDIYIKQGHHGTTAKHMHAPIHAQAHICTHTHINTPPHTRIQLILFRVDICQNRS